jgi:DNA invertase Pin-like site-specific DNA recombinase
MVVGIMAVVAQAERKMISARTKAALQAAKDRGVKLGLRLRADGWIVKLAPEAIAAGRAARTEKSKARAADVAPIIADLKSFGALPLRQIAAGLNERGIPTARGGEWSAVQVRRVIPRS